ncbi:MAG: hypothetical protein ACYS26_18565 [Planctomycetota bacterium]|jgi:hypothetical protein
MSSSTPLTDAITEALEDRLDLWRADLDAGAAEHEDEPTEADILEELIDQACTGDNHVDHGHPLTRLQILAVRRHAVATGHAAPLDRAAVVSCTLARRTLFTLDGVRYEYAGA